MPICISNVFSDMKGVTPADDTLQSFGYIVSADFLMLEQPFSSSWAGGAACTGGTLPAGSSCSLGASAVADAGTPDAEVHDSASEVQLASKTSESQKPLIRPVTDSPQRAASMTNDAKISSSQESNTVSTASRSIGTQRGGDTEPTSTYTSSSSNLLTAQDSIKHGVADYLTSKGDAESREPGSSIPAAHQLRALSAGRALVLSALLPCSSLPLHLPCILLCCNALP